MIEMNTRKNKIFIITALIAAIALFLAYHFYTHQQKVYSWIDEQNHLLVMIESKTNTNLPNYLSKDEMIRFEIVKDPILLPLKKKEGFQYTVYKAQYPKKERISFLLSAAPKPRIFLIGETHLGKSQLEVAEVVCSLIREFEIDAILLEQPDNVNPDFDSYYAQLRTDPERVINTLCYQMISQANEVKGCDEEVEKYQKIFAEYEKKHKELEDTRKILLERYPILLEVQKEDKESAIKKISEYIVNKYGEDEVNQFIQKNTSLMELSQQVETFLTQLTDYEKSLENSNCKTLRANYQNSQYFSASDYFYIVLNLKKMQIGFHNIESPELRNKFKEQLQRQQPAEDTIERDNYMTSKIHELVKKYEYRNMIVIVGALHLNNMKTMLNDRYEVVVKYDSLNESLSFKPTMAAYKFPDQILSSINNTLVPSDFTLERKYQLDETPSSQLTDQLRTFLEKNIEDSQKIDKLIAQFTNDYKEKKLKGVDSWSLRLSGNDVVVKRDTKGVISFEFELKSDINEKIQTINQQNNVIQVNLRKIGEIDGVSPPIIEDQRITKIQVHNTNLVQELNNLIKELGAEELGASASETQVEESAKIKYHYEKIDDGTLQIVLVNDDKNEIGKAIYDTIQTMQLAANTSTITLMQ